mgnify:CR=1 FL=1
MKQKKLEGLLVPSVVAGVVAGVLLLPVGGGSVCVGEDKTGTAGPHMSRQDANEDRSNAAAVPDVVPQVAECAELLFEADFSHGNVPEQWIPLHGTQWSVVEGSLEGRPSTKSFQTKRIAAGNASHSGKTPSSRLLVPVDDCVLLFRFQLVDGLSGVHFGFNDGSFNDQDVNQHQLESYGLHYAQKAKTLNNNSSDTDIFNVMGQLESLKRIKKSGELENSYKEKEQIEQHGKPKS